MHRLVPLFLVLLGLFSAYSQFIGIGSYAHFDLTSLCKDGLTLSNQHTDSEQIGHFINRCEQFAKIFREGNEYVFTANIAGGLVSLLLIVLGINFRVVSMWYAKFI